MKSMFILILKIQLPYSTLFSVVLLMSLFTNLLLMVRWGTQLLCTLGVGYWTLWDGQYFMQQLKYTVQMYVLCIFSYIFSVWGIKNVH